MNVNWFNHNVNSKNNKKCVITHNVQISTKNRAILWWFLIAASIYNNFYCMLASFNRHAITIIYTMRLNYIYTTWWSSSKFCVLNWIIYKIITHKWTRCIILNTFNTGTFSSVIVSRFCEKKKENKNWI